MKNLAQHNLQSLFTIAGFEVFQGSAFSKNYNISLSNCNINNPSLIKWEGLYGEIPPVINNMLTGICLWDSRWKIEFINKKKESEPGAVKVLSLEIPRKEAHKFINEGRRVKSLTIPIDLGRYHTCYLKWLNQTIGKLTIDHIYIHVPINEYHVYINEIEDQLKRPLPEIHDHLQEFGDNVKNRIKEIVNKAGIRHTFLDPMKDYNIKNPVDSYKFAYNILPAKFPKENFFAFEDISEFKLVTDSLVKNGMFGVFDYPDPYLDKTTDQINSKNFIFH